MPSEAPSIYDQAFDQVQAGLSEVPHFPFDANQQQTLSQIGRKEKTLPELNDAVVAVNALYLEDGKFDMEGFKTHLENLYAQGIRTFLIEGTTGESTLHSHAEHLDIIAQACLWRQNKNQNSEESPVYIIGGTGSNSTEEQNSMTQEALAGGATRGADASLILPPYYLKASEAAIGEHLWEALDRGPAIIYSISGRTACPIPLEVIYELAKHPHFLGVKECDGPERIKALSDKGIKVWTGEDGDAAKNLDQDGASGIISVNGNLDPNNILNLTDGQRGISEITQSIRLATANFLEGFPNPAPVHYAVEAMLREQNSERAERKAGFRNPVQGIPEAIQPSIHQRLKAAGIDVTPLGNNYVNLSNPTHHTHGTW